MKNRSVSFLKESKRGYFCTLKYIRQWKQFSKDCEIRSFWKRIELTNKLTLGYLKWNVPVLMQHSSGVLKYVFQNNWKHANFSRGSD